MVLDQADESLIHPEVPFVHASSALGSSAHNMDSTQRSVTYIFESVPTSEETLFRVPSVSVEGPPRTGEDADTELSPSASYTHSPLQPVGRGMEPLQMDNRHDSFTGFSDSVITDSPYASRLSIDTIHDAESDSDSTAVSGSTPHCSQCASQRTPCHAKAQGTGDLDVGDTVAGAQADARPEYRNTFHSSPASTESSHVASCEGPRLYTGSLGMSLELPVNSSNAVSRDPSIISDGGVQQRFRQLQTNGSQPAFFEYLSNTEESEEEDSDSDTKYELQEQIVNAFEDTKNYQGQIHQFLPANELCRIVNPETVAQELQKEFGSTHPAKDNQELADEICRERIVPCDSRDKITSFRKVFALLVISEAVSSIRLFISELVSDVDLPLVAPTGRNLRGLCRRNALGESSNKILRCFKGWSPMKLGNFREYQWKLLAPFFAQGQDGDVKHYRLQGQHILPFLSIKSLEGVHKEDAEKVGGYGRVVMVRIHQHHHGFKDARLNARGFAIKSQLHECDARLFRTEIDVLKKFSGDRGHKHIVSLLATFEQFNKLHLIFYRAEGDMFAYWNDRQSQPLPTKTNVVWLAAQCAGLSHGLLQLHRQLTFTRRRSGHQDRFQQHHIDGLDDARVTPKCPAERQVIWGPLPSREDVRSPNLSFDNEDSNISSSTCPTSHDGQSDGHDNPNYDSDKGARKQYGRHGDIHPGNVLWYDDTDGEPDELTGTLKIADFGQAELNTLKSKTKERHVANTLTYRPPECDQGQDRIPPTIRQTYDMWCLGCVYLEFVTWFLGGGDLLSEFTASRMTPDLFQNNLKTDAFFQAIRVPGEDTNEFRVKRAVIRFIDRLHRLPQCPQYCHELLLVIQRDMLVIHSEERKSCEEIWIKLHRLYERCCVETDFADRGNPWDIRRESFSRPVVVPFKEEEVPLTNRRSRSRFLRSGPLA